MKILIAGTGGVGGYFGAKLAQNEDVTFLARGSHAAAMRENGLKVESIDGNFVIPNPKIIEDLKTGRSFDLIIVAVKAYQLEGILDQLPDALAEGGVVWPLLNGIAAEKQLSKVFPKEKIVHGLCKIFSRIKEDGVIEHFGYQPTLHFGKHYPVDEVWLDRIEDLLKRNALHYYRDQDIVAEKYKKWLFICSGGLTAYYEQSYGALMEDLNKVDEMRALFEEIAAVAQAEGVHLAADLPEKTLQLIAGFPYHATSSMQRDIAEGRASELEELNGTVVQLGGKWKLPTPVNSKVYKTLKSRSEK